VKKVKKKKRLREKKKEYMDISWKTGGGKGGLPESTWEKPQKTTVQVINQKQNQKDSHSCPCI